MNLRILRKVQKAVERGEYYLTDHAFDELIADHLTEADMAEAIQNGTLVKIEKDDRRGPRYTVIGYSSASETEIGVVVRFTESGLLRVITVYETSQEH